MAEREIAGLIGGLVNVSAKNLPRARAALVVETEARVRVAAAPFLKDKSAAAVRFAWVLPNDFVGGGGGGAGLAAVLGIGSDVAEEAGGETLGGSLPELAVLGVSWEERSVGQTVSALIKEVTERVERRRGGGAMRVAAMMCRYGEHEACWFAAVPGKQVREPSSHASLMGWGVSFVPRGERFHNSTLAPRIFDEELDSAVGDINYVRGSEN